MTRSSWYYSLFLIILMATPARMLAQTPRILSWQEIEEILDYQDISMPVSRGYEYRDNGGLWDVLLCEAPYHISGKDTLRNRIKVVCLLHDHGGYLKKWEINDFLEDIPEDTRMSNEVETDIQFWANYCQFNDLDGDGYANPIIVYASIMEGDNSTQYRRIKIITLFQKQKYVIRAIECGLDHCRSLKYPSNYNQLPLSVRQHIKKLLARIRKEKGVILSDG